MAVKIIKLDGRTYERLDFFRNEDQTWEAVIEELLDNAGAWRIEDVLKEAARAASEMKRGHSLTLDEVKRRLSAPRKKR